MKYSHHSCYCLHCALLTDISKSLQWQKWAVSQMILRMFTGLQSRPPFSISSCIFLSSVRICLITDRLICWNSKGRPRLLWKQLYYDINHTAHTLLLIRNKHEFPIGATSSWKCYSPLQHHVILKLQTVCNDASHKSLQSTINGWWVMEGDGANV